MDRATSQLTKAFGVDEERSDRVREKAPLAAVLIDRNGCLLDDKAVAISSFGGALPLTIDMRLGDLGAWPSLEHRLAERLDNMLRRVDEQDRSIPLSRDAIMSAY